MDFRLFHYNHYDMGELPVPCVYQQRLYGYS